MKRKNIKIILISALLSAVFVVLFILWVIDHPKTSFTIPSTSPHSKTTANNNVAQESNDSTQTFSGSSDSNHSLDKSSTVNSDPSGPLSLNPAQTFVSNHKPGQNGSPTTEQSVCNTTPGATCYIEFTKGILIRSLTAKAADSQGQIIWNWDVKSADFPAGLWQITAIASLNGQTKRVNDQMLLEVQ